MHDLHTIQKMNREASLAAITESVTEADEVEAARKAAMQRHPAGSERRITEPAIDPAARTPEEIADAMIENMEREMPAYASGHYSPNDDQWRAAIIAGIEADRAQRAEPAIVTTHDSRCTLDRLHDGECNVNEWRG